jgi:hypothetical protein
MLASPGMTVMELQMANAHRGEIDAVLDGKTFKLCLTLGALAELEAAFGDEDMLALAQRFGGGRLSARDCVRLIGAGLRGGGYEIGDDAVRAMRAENGAAGYVDVVARLLRATFGEDTEGRRASAEEPAHGPFPGTK